MITKSNAQTPEHRSQMRGGDGVVSLKALCSELPANVRLFSEIRLVPGASIGEHVHENETELFYFIQGEGTVTDDGVTLTVQAGDCMVTTNGHSHSVKNTGTEDLVIVAVIVLD